MRGRNIKQPEKPEGKTIRYVPYESTNMITQIPIRKARLQKNRLIHQWHQNHHYTILFWGLDNIYRIFIASNGAEFVVCQVVMLTKSAQDLVTPLFVGINVSPEGDVVIICNIGMKGEAKAMLSHFGVYLVVIFGSIV